LAIKHTFVVPFLAQVCGRETTSYFGVLVFIRFFVKLGLSVHEHKFDVQPNLKTEHHVTKLPDGCVVPLYDAPV